MPSMPITVPAQREMLRLPDAVPSLADPAPAQREQAAVMNELRAVKGLIEDRFSALAFMEQLHRNPRQSTLSQRLLESGFSPALTRKLVEHLPAEVTDEVTWAQGVLSRNLQSDEASLPIEDLGGVYALIGATGVGKTTSTAKIAASFAARHGVANLGLITLDAYRMAAHEQLRAYGRILGVPVHTAHDRASLDDLLELLAGKKLVLIDTAGMAQRDQRTRELLDMLAHRAIQRLLVVNAASQGETIEDVMQAYNAASCRGAVLSKIDEAVKFAPALDALIRHKLRVVGVANGQRARRLAPPVVERADPARDASGGHAGVARRAVRHEPDVRRAAHRDACGRRLARLIEGTAMSLSTASNARAANDQAAGLRRMFGSARRCFIALAHNDQVAQASLVIDRLCDAAAATPASTLFVDAADSAPAPHEMALIDLARRGVDRRRVPRRPQAADSACRPHGCAPCRGARVLPANRPALVRGHGGSAPVRGQRLRPLLLAPTPHAR
jgi:flagellar biosynthetic protein FlhF